MKKFSTISFILVTGVLFSCQKEIIDPGDNSGGGGVIKPGMLLVKLVVKTGQDSSVSVFGYNTSNKIISFILSGVESGQALDSRINYVRNASGIIEKQILRSNDLAAIGMDSIVTIINYNAANSQYQSGVSVLSIFGIPARDSIIFQYDGTGRLATEIDYSDIGLGYVPASKTEYSYSGDNLLGEKIYSYDDGSSTYNLEETYTYEYDTKKNPLQFVSDAPILNLNPFYPANNITKTTFAGADPANNFISTETYTYNSSDRPVASTNVTGSQTSAITYYYQ